MTKLKAHQFRDACSSVRDAIASLTSCHREEIPNEARILGNVLAELRAAELVRKDPELSERKANIINRAEELLAQRNAQRIDP
jgi:hypothetical protein